MNKIIWSPRARITYFRILQYLQENWTIKEVLNFNSRTENVLDLIRKNPKLYPYSKDQQIFRCYIVKQVSLFYAVKESQIELLVFWDNRQDPKKLFKN